jgi:hypothetical protein
MVQIRREHLHQRTSSFFRSILAFIRFLLLSAVIPSVFVLRHYWFGWTTPDVDGASLVLVPITAAATTTSKLTAISGNEKVGNLRSSGSAATPIATTEESQLSSPPPPSLPPHLVQFLQTLLLPTSTTHLDVNDRDGTNTHDNDNTNTMVHHYNNDWVELDHCNIAAILNDPTSLLYLNFTAWSYPILNATVSDLVRERAGLFATHGAAIAIATATDGSATTSEATSSPTAPKTKSLSLMQRVQQEFLLELLEMYATASGHCDFSRYKPTVPSISASTAATDKNENENDDADVALTASGLLSVEVAATKLREAADLLELQGGGQTQERGRGSDHNSVKLARLAVSIVAYKDIHHLQRLIQAIHLPIHVIIVHLDRRTSAEFAQQVREFADEYDNVVVLQFGTIVYKTDSVSMVNLRIMRWLVYDLELTFDYFITLGGAAYPLQDAHDLAYSLQQTGRRIWLGELTLRGERVKSPQDSRLRRKLLLFTGGSFGNARNTNTADSDAPMIPILVKRLPSTTFSGESLPDVIVESMTQKSVSGNNAIFAYDTVKELLDSPDVMELFARSKYGCCCCLEEHNWIAALTMIGLQEEALEQASMWQVWGGAETCQGSMKNALLSRNASLCYRLEDATLDPPQMYIRGDATMDFLKDAKRRGFYFARKFHSNNPESMELLEDIRTDLHGNDFI